MLKVIPVIKEFKVIHGVKGDIGFSRNTEGIKGDTGSQGIPGVTGR